MQDDLGTILKRECGEKKGEEFVSCVNDVLVKRHLPIHRKHHKEWEHRDNRFLFWLGDDNGQYYFGMKTMSPTKPYYSITKASKYLNDKPEFDALLYDPNFDWLNTRNETYVLAEQKPEYVWDSERGEFVRA